MRVFITLNINNKEAQKLADRLLEIGISELLITRLAQIDEFGDTNEREGFVQRRAIR
jgi:uncharacterized protein YpiB (UPF0302 family)